MIEHLVPAFQVAVSLSAQPLSLGGVTEVVETICTLVAHPTVKDHDFCCKPVVVLSWSRVLSATSFAPVVITPLYLVFLAKCVVVDVPKGFRVALSPSVLRLTVTLVICVVLPSGLTLKSLKVEVVIEDGIIFSEKVAVRFEEGATPVAPALGTVLMTLGELVSVTENPSALRHSAPEQPLSA